MKCINPRAAAAGFDPVFCECPSCKSARQQRADNITASAMVKAVDAPKGEPHAERRHDTAPYLGHDQRRDTTPKGWDKVEGGTEDHEEKRTSRAKAIEAAARAALTYLEDDCEPHWSDEQRAVVDDLRKALA